MCGNVICERFDPSKPFFTANGSFWSNSTTELLASTSDADRQARTRNRCNGEGYESVALLPLNFSKERLGLLQLNDRRTGMFTPQVISLWERLAGYLAAALAKFRSEEALQESEKQFRTLADAIPQLCWMANADGWITWYNRRWYEYTGTTPEQMEGWGWQSVHDPEVLPDVMERWQVSIATGKPFDMVFPLRGADGVFRPFLTRIMPVCDQDGKVVRWFGTNTDISEQLKTEETLREQAALLDLAHDAIIVRDTNDKVVFWNLGAEETYGWTPEEAMGHVTHDLLKTRFPKPLAEIAEEVAEKGRWEGELTYSRKDGQVIVVASRWAAQRDTSGRQVGVLEINRDISERKQGEAYRSMGQDILLVLNENENQKEAIKRVIDIIKSATGVDAVGIRLQDEDDFPYFYQEGFPQDFLLKENSLLTRTKDGGICRDECGDICLECTCGLVVTGKTDPSSPLFTKGGSSWTNDSFPFLHVPVDDDIRTNPRNECIHQGFASVALIPIRAKGRVVGLLQLNDRRKGCFTLEGIETLEKIAENVGESMLRKQAEEALRESEEQFRTLFETMTEGFSINEIICDEAGKPSIWILGTQSGVRASYGPEGRRHRRADCSRDVPRDRATLDRAVRKGGPYWRAGPFRGLVRGLSGGVSK